MRCYECLRAQPIRPSGLNTIDEVACDLTDVRVADVDCDAVDAEGEGEAEDIFGDASDDELKGEGEVVELRAEAEEECAPRRVAPTLGSPRPRSMTSTG